MIHMADARHKISWQQKSETVSGGVAMRYTINSGQLQVQIDSHGGSLWSIKDMEGTEYLWQGDPRYWKNRAPNLFPYIGRLTEGKYTLDGKEYRMDRHGFVRDNNLQLLEKGEDFVRLFMRDNSITFRQYPYRFIYEICYQVEGNRLCVTCQVDNMDTRNMFFGMGGHPGFNVPIEQGLNFEDYALEFPQGEGMMRVVLSEDFFVTDEREIFLPDENGKLFLKHSLFDKDAIVLDKVPGVVVLSAVKGKKGLKVSSPQMRYLGLWHAPGTDAPYVCIEPWTSLPSRDGVVEDLARQEDLVSLPPGERYINRWTIEVLEGEECAR